jgi:stage III sporulation protein AD
MTVVAISAAGIAAVLLAAQFKGGKSEYGLYIIMASGILFFFFGTGQLRMILDGLKTLEGYLDIHPIYIRTLIKMIGITYVAEFASGICKDGGFGALGNQIEIFGKLSILGISMPILLALFSTLEQFLA